MVERAGRSSWGVVLLTLGLLAWPAVSGLRAQDQAPQGGGSSPPSGTPMPLPAPPASPTQVITPQPGPPPLIAPGEQPPPPQPPAAIEPPRFKFTIAPNTALKDLLPVPPKAKRSPGPVTAEDLARVPEVEFQAALAKNLPSEEALKRTAHQLAKINHLNGKKMDGFLEALRDDRPDLAGLPFAMGDACRTTGERSRQFANAVANVRAALGQRTVGPIPFSGPPGSVGPVAGTGAAVDAGPAESFWDQYQAMCIQEDRGLARVDRTRLEDVTLARLRALMQVLAPEAPSMRLGLVKYLAAVSHAEATRALARLAVFSPEDEVRQAAVEALKVRREKDYTDLLLGALRYPWPAVARRATDALVKLERSDLLPQLVDLLDQPDPRAPTMQEVNDKPVPVVRELVRVNHHRSCMLCHAPANTGSVAPDTLTAAVPIPQEPLPLPSEGYRRSSPDVTVRIDVTYLRQDFSMWQPVADANPWPEMQRFDFLVRTRVLGDAEAAAYREQFASAEPGRPSPYQRAVLAALRELTGKDAEPTPEAWRRLLGLPAGPRRAARG